MSNLIPFFQISEHCGRVMESCRTDEQLENAYHWTQSLIKNISLRHGRKVYDMRKLLSDVFEMKYKEIQKRINSPRENGAVN